MNGDAYRAFLALLQRLDRAKISYRLSHPRDEAIMIDVDVPGERWEIELVDYGDELHWEVERFRSNGAIDDESAIEDLFANHSDPIEEPAVSHEHDA
jgi:hypothetical protein